MLTMRLLPSVVASFCSTEPTALELTLFKPVTVFADLEFTLFKLVTVFADQLGDISNFSQ